MTSRANYRRVIGVDPGTLAAGTPVDRLSPNVLARAIAQGQAQSSLGTCCGLWCRCCRACGQDQRRGALSEPRGARAACCKGTKPAFEVIRLTQASAVAQLSVPIYQGGGSIRGASVQGNAGPAAAQSRRQPRPGAGDRGAKLGPTRCRQGADRVDDGAGATRPRSRSTACARKRASDSGPRSTCSTPSRNW